MRTQNTEGRQVDAIFREVYPTHGAPGIHEAIAAAGLPYMNTAAIYVRAGRLGLKRQIDPANDYRCPPADRTPLPAREGPGEGVLLDSRCLRRDLERHREVVRMVARQEPGWLAAAVQLADRDTKRMEEAQP